MFRVWLAGLILLMVTSGCASSDRMVRMSGGVFEEYSAPKSSRLRSEKYQKVSRELSSATRSNRVNVAGLDDTLINIWPFFFRSNDYWTALWPLIDKDPYGFAFRPFYNHEGDDYSILFPLTAWNPASGRGWITLWGWTPDGFGLVPFSWQWKEKYSGGAYYTPLFIYTYDRTPLEYLPVESRNGISVRQNWSRDDFDLFAFLFYRGEETRVDKGEWRWLFNLWHPNGKNVWNYKFDGKKAYPADPMALEKFRQEIFASLPRIKSRGYGLIPFWYGLFSGNGDYRNRFMLLAGNRKYGKNYNFDILGDVFAGYELREEDFSSDRWYKIRESFTSWVLLSHFEKKLKYISGGNWDKFDRLYSLCNSSDTFAQNKPAISDALKALDPALTLPEKVVDHETLRFFIDDLSKKYEFPVYPEYSGRIVPFIWYGNKQYSSYCVLPVLLTWWDKRENEGNFTSLPLLTWVKRSKHEDKTIIFTPLFYYAKEKHRERGEYRILSRNNSSAWEGDCVEIRDRYAGCGLFYRGRFGFNVAKAGIDAASAEHLRVELQSLPGVHRRLENEAMNIENERNLTDRWQVTSEIERLRKLIRYEELKIRQLELLKKRSKYRAAVVKAMNHARTIGLAVTEKSFADEAEAAKTLAGFMEKYTELRFYEDIGSGVFFNRREYYNGDYNWHFLHILAGGEKTGGRESSHILHLLYRYRKEGDRSERVFFPFISSVKDGKNSRFSFLWRVFSLSKRDGKTGGYFFFIPFGETE
ncbi:MAG: hypothetical protein E7043_06660 [Lentisphaerae bacterium]|nr:hypothetical protein [Lentisphaerota bacterium]